MELTETDTSLLVEANDTGRAEVARVDEAEMWAAGFLPVLRGPAARELLDELGDLADPRVGEGGRRLVGRGLAQEGSADRRSLVTAVGALAMALAATRGTNDRLDIRDIWPDGDPVTLNRRVFVLTPQLGWPMTLVQSLDVPRGAGADPLPVRMDAVRPELLVDDLVAAAFAAPAAPSASRTIWLTPVGQEPWVLEFGAAGVELVSSKRGLFRRSQQRRPIDREEYRSRLTSLLAG